MVMKCPWIAEAVIDWKLEFCRHKGTEETYCNECQLNGKICEKLSELAITIADEMKREEWK